MSQRHIHPRPFLLEPHRQAAQAHNLLEAELEDIRRCLTDLEQVVDSGDEQQAA